MRRIREEMKSCVNCCVNFFQNHTYITLLQTRCPPVLYQVVILPQCTRPASQGSPKPDDWILLALLSLHLGVFVDCLRFGGCSVSPEFASGGRPRRPRHATWSPGPSDSITLGAAEDCVPRERSTRPRERRRGRERRPEYPHRAASIARIA